MKWRKIEINHEGTKRARRSCHRQVNSPEASKLLAGWENTNEEGFISFVRTAAEINPFDV